MQLQIERMSEPYASQIATWRYEEPYAVYSLRSGDNEWLLLEQHQYHYITSEELGLVGFFCVGFDARVPGVDYSDEALDIGLGLRPDLTGKGLSGPVLTAILNYCCSHYAPSLLRLTVATFNRRAIRAYEKAGFRPVQVYQVPQGEYLQMTRTASGMSEVGL